MTKEIYLEKCSFRNFRSPVTLTLTLNRVEVTKVRTSGRGLPTHQTRHRASTSMYSLTFCVRFLLPEGHQWKPADQTVAVMLRTPPVGGRSPAGRLRPLTVCGARFLGPPVARRSPAGGARRPRPAGRSHYVVISRDGRKLVTRVGVMLP